MVDTNIQSEYLALKHCLIQFYLSLHFLFIFFMINIIVQLKYIIVQLKYF